MRRRGGPFRHESGIQIDGVLKNSKNYEPFSPDEIGAEHAFSLGKHTGAGAVSHMCKKNRHPVFLSGNEPCRYS